MTSYIIFKKKNGEILHVHSVFDGATGTFRNLSKEDVLKDLSDFFPEPEKVDVIAVEEPVQLYRMRVNPSTKKLEEIQEKKEGH
jgi:hypothetical protein